MKTGNKKYLFPLLLTITLISIFNGVLNVNFGLLSDYALEANFKEMTEVAKDILLIGLGLMVSVMLTNYCEKEYLRNTMVDMRLSYINTLFKRHKLSEPNSVYISNLSNDADRLEKQYYQSLLFLFKLLIQIIISVIILAQYSIHFITVVAVLAFIFFIVARKTSEPVKKEESVKSKELEGYTNFVEETLNGFSVIKSHQIEDKRQNDFFIKVEGLKKQHYKIEKQKSLVDAFNGTLQGILIGTLIVLGLFAGSKLGFSIGGSIVVTLVFSDIMWPLQRVTPLITEIYGMKSILDNYNDVLNKPEEDGKEAIDKFESIAFINANLGYDTPILSEVNISIQKGEKVLIIGPSGAGKSTILKTLQREIDILGGEVLMNSKSIKEYALDAYYQLISIVDQIGFIFSGTVQENISMLKNNNTIPYLNKVDLSYMDQNTLLINNGDNISGGERARLLLARALLHDKELIICDEILSSLDTEVARSIEKDILHYAPTLINVSHIVFIENLQYYDKYIIVENGSIQTTTDPSFVIDRMMDTDIEFK